MPTRVTTSGTFKAQATDWGITETRESELPQYFLEFTLHALWDADNEEWIDYTEQDESHSDYFCLYGKQNQELLVSKQIAKIFGWTGTSFSELARLDVSEIEFQVRIEENDAEYADKRPFKAEWLDVADAIPGSGIAKLDDAGLSTLDKKFAIALKKGGKKVAAKSASEKPAPKKPASSPAPEEPAEVTNEQKQKNLAEKAKKNRARKVADAKTEDDDKKVQAGETVAKPKATRPRPGAKSKNVVKFPALDGDTAWDSICEAQAEAGIDDAAAETVLNTVSAKVTGKEDYDMELFTEEQWGEIAVRTIAEIQSAK